MSETTGFYAPSRANIEQLQIILGEQTGTSVTFEEAEEVGIELISLYECLARERSDTKEGEDGRID